MTRMIITFLLLLMSISPAPSQESPEAKLNFTLALESTDRSNTLVLQYRGKASEAIDGCFYSSRQAQRIDAKIMPGGFNFLDSDIFGLGVLEPQMRRRWAENRFPIQDIESLVNEPDLERVLSFRIIPEPISPSADSIFLFFKYALLDQTQAMASRDYRYQVQLFYKQIRVPYDIKMPVDFLKAVFKDHEISVRVDRAIRSAPILTLKNPAMVEGIRKSSQESELRAFELDLTIELLRTDASKAQAPYILPFPNSLSRYQIQSLSPVTALEGGGPVTVEQLAAPVYSGHIRLPFQLYNPAKALKYQDYKTRQEIFQSDYAVILAPIAFRGDTLTVDLFIEYQKLRLDQLPRWTPIHKRIQLVKTRPQIVELPKENWTADFSRQGESYQIYGYADYERAVTEFLLLAWNSITKP